MRAETDEESGHRVQGVMWESCARVEMPRVIVACPRPGCNAPNLDCFVSVAVLVSRVGKWPYQTQIW